MKGTFISLYLVYDNCNKNRPNFSADAEISE